MKTRLFTLIIAMLAAVAVRASEVPDSVPSDTGTGCIASADTLFRPLPAPKRARSIYDNIYAQPYSQNKNV